MRWSRAAISCSAISRRCCLAVASPLTHDAPATAHAGVQSRQLPPHLGAAGGGEAVVTRYPAPPGGLDRRQDRAAWPVDRLPDGGGHSITQPVPGDPRRHRGTPAAAAGSILTGGAISGRLGVQQDACVKMRACEPCFPPTQSSSAGRRALTGSIAIRLLKDAGTRPYPTP